MSATDAVTGSDHPPPGVPVRESTQGTWFRLPDGTPGSRVRLPAGTEAAPVRRVRRLGLPGLLPIAALHARGLGHGALDPTAVLIAPDGAPVLVALTGGSGHRERDLTAWAGLAYTLAAAWCGSETPTCA